MKIIFMGTPEFAVAPLDMLAVAGHELGMVFTQPDKAKGRGNKLQPFRSFSRSVSGATKRSWFRSGPTDRT